MGLTYLTAIFLGALVISLSVIRLVVSLPGWLRIYDSLRKEVLRVSFLLRGEQSALPQPRAEPMTRAEVKGTYSTDTWQRRSYDNYVSILLAKDKVYPCIYATKGYKANEQLFTFIGSDDLSERRHVDAVGSALRSYLRQTRRLGPNTSLVILAPQIEDVRLVEEYNRLFWELLKGLAHLDQKPWPKAVPKDIDTPQWCFCFDGEPLFSVVLTPAHHQRHSRFSPSLCVVFQPKWIFDILFSTPQKQAGAMNKVRSLLNLFDDIAISPDLKNLGDEESRVSKQYFLMDENTSAICPCSNLEV